jgi:hypothetical protein
MSDNPHKPKLVFIGEPFEGRVYELTLERTYVGRGDHNALVIHAPAVSLTHCEIMVHGPEVIVRDLGSANGTFVNGIRLQNQQAQLKSGQLVGFGPVEARLELAAAAEDTKAKTITAVLAHRQAVLDHQRELNHPARSDPAMTLDDGSHSSGPQRTSMLPKLPALPKSVTLTTANLARRKPRRGSKRMAIVIAAALAALAAVLLLLLWWSRKK